MSATAVGWVYQHSPYTGVAFTVHLALADSANDQNGNELWARQSWIAAKSRTTRGTVSRALQNMVDDGMLELVEEREGHPNRYRLLTPDVDPVWAPRGVVREHTPPPEGVRSEHRGCNESAQGGVSVAHTQQNPRENPTGELNQNGSADADTNNDYDPAVVELCRDFAQRLVANRKGVPKRGTGAHRRWLEDMRLLLTYGQSSTMEGGHVPTPDEVHRVIAYVTTDGFERDNVLSPGKLRKRWDQLYGKASGQANGNGRASGGTAMDVVQRAMAAGRYQ